MADGFLQVSCEHLYLNNIVFQELLGCLKVVIYLKFTETHNNKFVLHFIEMRISFWFCS